MRLVIITLLVLFSVGCASSGPLRDLHYIADDWVLAAVDKPTNIQVHAKQLNPITEDVSIGVKESLNYQFYEKTIRVQSGEWLSMIALREYGSKHAWREIVRVNGLTYPYTIHAGQELRLPYPDVEYIKRSQQIKLDRWGVRMVNAGKKDICARVSWIQMDYFIDVQQAWYVMPSFSTKYLGSLIQEPWVLSETAFAFDDAKWAVNEIRTVPFVDGECQIKEKS